MDTARRKSCNACVRSKRRCILLSGRPRCQRCQSRNIDCMYPDFLPKNVSGQWSPRDRDQDDAPVAGGLDGGHHVLARTTANAAVAMPSPSMNGTWFEFCNEPFNLPDLPNGDLVGLQAMGDVVSVPSPSGIDQIDRSSDVQVRSEFVSKRLAGIPKCFVEQAQTPFIHRSLLQSNPDPALQDALNVAALYFLRNDNNRLLAIRNLEHKSRHLIETTNLEAIDRLGLLAATQALLIYQLIRFFDGDIRLRAQAEADDSSLTSWTSQLRSYSTTPVASTNLSLNVGQNQILSHDWQSWLVEESIRRTIIMALMLKGIYHFLKTGRDTEQDLRLSFNARASLWNAQSRQSWLTKQDEGGPLEMRVVHWNEDIKKAIPGDLDELGVQIMVMLWGVDATAQWLGPGHVTQRGLESI